MAQAALGMHSHSSERLSHDSGLEIGMDFGEVKIRR